MNTHQYTRRNPTFPTCPTCYERDGSTGEKVFAVLDRGLCPCCRRVFVPWLTPDTVSEHMPRDAIVMLKLPTNRVMVYQSHDFIRAPFAIDGWLPLPEAEYNVQ